MTIPHLIAQQREFFNSGQTKSYAFRLEALRRLSATITAHRNEIAEALRQDLNKSQFESYATEIGFVLGEINEAIRHLKRWMKPRKCKTPLILFGSRSAVVCEPYGVTLIIAPWNYPFQLQLSPLVGALAAGNCAVLKPAVQSPRVTAILKKIIEACFDPQHVAVADIPNTAMNELLAERFDYIFYTGGVDYGKQVMVAAARHLTPVTLELGGKSPCIVERDAHLEIAARRIVWGKFINAGQTCVAPDYILVEHSIRTALIEALKKEIVRQYGADPKMSDDYCRIINHSHTERLAARMQEGRVIFGGEVDLNEQYIAPTLLVDVQEDSLLMQEEIFGPLLPILTFEQTAEAIAYVNGREKPLALYYFTQDGKKADHLLRSTSSGGACINDVVVQVANTHLPFGGVGNSGMGNYHGTYSFETFSHHRGVVRTTTRFNIGVKFAPYKKKLQLLEKAMK